MSPSHSHIVGAVIGANPLSPEDDDDDICPVCESECTCQNRANPAQNSRHTDVAPLFPSTSSSHDSVAYPPTEATAGVQSLKIKLTLPPNLKFRKQNGSRQSNVLASQSRPSLIPSLPESFDLPTTGSDPSRANAHRLALGILDPVVPKRRGRPPKVIVAARETGNAVLQASHKTAVVGGAESVYARDPGSSGDVPTYAHGLGKGKNVSKYNPPRKSVALAKQKPRGKTTTGRKTLAVANGKNILKAFPSGNLSDDSVSGRFPTFISAASTPSHTSSSESSDSDLSSLDSEIEEETRLLVHGERGKAYVRKHSTNSLAEKKRQPGSGDWDMQSRMTTSNSEEDVDVGIDSSSAEENEASEGTDDQVSEDDDLDADTEGGGLDDIDPDNEETSSRIGVTFGDGAASWSDDDDESFDADLFFANLDGSSDSDSSPALRAHDPFDFISDMEFSASLSADEEDALLLMDIDPTVQVRRGNGELEFGLELDSLSFGLDGQYLFAGSSPQSLFDLGFGFHHANTDLEMQVETQESSEAFSDGTEAINEVLLEETDGETTEDELVDSDGLPNRLAMMIFRWPHTVSTINPLSTVSSTTSLSPQAPPDASESVRIALASYSAQQGPPTTPTAADILAGKIPLDDFEDVEMDKSVGDAQRRRRSSGPVMGEFVAGSENAQPSAVINGRGPCIPSPFPRSKVRQRSSFHEVECSDTSADAVRALVSYAVEIYPNPSDFQVEPPSESVLSSTQSSDENLPHSHLLPPAEVIDLDDVLDSSILDPEAMSHDLDDQPYESLELTPSATPSAHIHSLSRWDRIPMATFRRTRETAIGSAVEGSTSDTGLSVYGGIGSLMGTTMLTPSKAHDKKSSSARKRSKAKTSNMLMLPNELLPLRDGDQTPRPTSPRQPFKSSKKEARREKAMMKRKMMTKPVQHRHQPPYRAHHHHPNHKTRASSSAQRMGNFAGSSSSPSFCL
ncbi:uncharacterized protein FIBRA_02406 [Fibroporia radiculosa]|uniref:Uncharacterized protein n=1 Tax=Fibroporia radiculosa TaxID=599839 RepID=J4I916_9APHY|nr:uncharacterized protein FIBRA_02406 [Fibroporia radiculosa]CCM00376.1 predicted protein [Fibroporia radiculosa]